MGENKFSLELQEKGMEIENIGARPAEEFQESSSDSGSDDSPGNKEVPLKLPEVPTDQKRNKTD